MHVSMAAPTTSPWLRWSMIPVHRCYFISCFYPGPACIKGSAADASIAQLEYTTGTPLLIHILFLSWRHISQGQRRQHLVRYRYTATNSMHLPRASPLLIHILSLYLSRRCMYGASRKKNRVSEKLFF